MSTCDFRLAIVKGLVEQGCGDAYFGSLGAYLVYQREAVDMGWVSLTDDGREMLTDLGRQLYIDYGLDTLPCRQGSRAYLWDWSQIRDAPRR